MPNLADNLTGWQNSHRRFLLPALLLAATYTGLVNWFRDYQFGIGKVVFCLCAVFVLLVCAPDAREGLSFKKLWPFAVFGTLTAFFIIAMRTALTPQGGGQWALWLLPLFLLFAATHGLCAAGLFSLLRRVALCESAPKKTPRWLWPALFGTLVALWLPAMAAFGPVRVSADSYDVLSQALGVSSLNDSHPIAYTGLVAMLLRPAKAAGSIMAGAYLFGFAQLCMVAAALSYTVVWLRRKGFPALLCGVALAFYSLSPVFAINAITLWKDIPFNCLLLLLMLYLYEIADSGALWLDRPKNAVRFLLVCAGACFARGNGFALVLVCCAAVVLCFRKRAKRLLCLFVPLLLCVALVLGPLYSALGITRLGGVEAAAVPLQQVGRVVAEGGKLTAAQREVIERFVPVEVMQEYYEPTSPDNVKKHPDFDSVAFSKNSAAFLGVWLSLLPHNAGTYLNAWLTQTMGYWKYDFAGRTAYMVDEMNGLFGIEYKDLVFGLTGLNFRQYLENRTGFPTMGLMALTTLYAAAMMLCSGGAQRKRALCLLPPLAVWLGLMAGAPTYCDFRYMLVFAFALPLILALPLCKGGKAPAAGV